VDELVRRLRALDARGRVFAGALGFAALLALAVAFLAQRDSRVALFAAPLRPEQVEEVAERLADWNVPFAVTTDNVRVEGARRNDVLLKLAMLGVPHPHLASLDDALAKAGPLTPQSILDAEQLDGRAGDLASGLRGVAGVEDARVIVAAARDGTFAGDDDGHAATASVRLTLRPGASLSSRVVASLRAYVAAGVPGLAPERVAVLDDRGVSFDEPGPQADDAGALQASLQSALDGALGAGSTIVRVRVSIDPRASRRRDVVRTPMGAAVATTTNDERFKSSTKQYAKTNAVLDRGSAVRDERIDTPAGRTERMSVAIAIDEARGFDAAKIRSLAEATLGLQPSRGDTISVEAMRFPRDPVPSRSLPLLAAVGAIVAIVPSTLVALAILLAARSFVRPVVAAIESLVRRIAVDRTSRAVAAYAPAHVRGALANEPPHTAAAIISALPTATATAVLEMYPPEERAAIVRRMSRAAAPAVPDHETVLRRA
jgi:flagellar biosynthesis/type III secretory pathway M-ring protein FliF/YscJ